MQGALRVIYEMIPSPGSNPSGQLDTDELDPASYDDVGPGGDVTYSIAVDANDQAIPILDSCLVILVSDYPILLRLSGSETQLRCRYFVVGAEDADGKAITARDLLVSGNGENVATLRVIHVVDT